MKRLTDVVIAAIVLVLASPVLLVFMFLVSAQDGKTPFYMAPRVSRGGGTFRMIKLRSMILNADKAGGSSTAVGDLRVTAVGRLIRKFKLDELTQLYNVLAGDMSLVGPRPQVRSGGVDLYTDVEMKLLMVRPGITDFSSIIFSDEGDILAGYPDPDLSYNQLIRPWKSRLGLFYVEHHNIRMDLELMYLTLVAILSKSVALNRIGALLIREGAPPDLVRIARRDRPLVPTPPPGAQSVVTSIR